ncbi:cyclic nucleotide-binding domain-containing protein 2-like [Petromyzon marinus]|uniref:cyclic nucleotide-binding domain-containing protein 2-like n=1 Tax=Petromyzon marinus TaxID=7757 RepID=UPI003F71EE44
MSKLRRGPVVLEQEHSKRATQLWKVARQVCVLSQVCRIFRSSNSALLTYEAVDASCAGKPSAYKINKTPEEQDVSGDDLLFDPNNFKSLYEFTLPEKAVRAALKPPSERSDTEVIFLRGLLRGLSSFRRYTAHLQLMLAGVVRYEKFGRRRVIVKKGHYGRRFYFVFSGLVAVTKDNDGSSAFIDPEPILLRKGAGFGEIALLKDLSRNATIVCMEETELLVVDKEDFFAYKLDQELRKEFQHRYNYFRSLELFSTWSDESLETMADHCKIEEFNHGQVVTGDTSETKNIIFVIKGCCDVLRLVDLSGCPSYHDWLQQQVKIQEKKIADIYMDPRSMLRDGNRMEHKEPGSGDEDEPRRLSLKSVGYGPSSPQPPATLLDDYKAAVYIRVDAIRPGQYFKGVNMNVLEGILEKDGKLVKETGLKQFLVPEFHRDGRPMVITSQGAKVLRVRLDKFGELMNDATLKELKKQSEPYPKDDALCQIFLEQNQWKLYKRELALAAAKGGKSDWRLRASKQEDARHKDLYSEWDAESAGIMELGSPLGSGKRVWMARSTAGDILSAQAGGRREIRLETAEEVPDAGPKRHGPRLIHSILVKGPNYR